VFGCNGFAIQLTNHHICFLALAINIYRRLCIRANLSTLYLVSYLFDVISKVTLCRLSFVVLPSLVILKWLLSWVSMPSAWFFIHRVRALLLSSRRNC